MNSVKQIVEEIYKLGNEITDREQFDNLVSNFLAQHEIHLKVENIKLPNNGSEYKLQSQVFDSDALTLISIVINNCRNNLVDDNFAWVDNIPLPAAIVSFDGKEIVSSNKLFDCIAVSKTKQLMCSESDNQKLCKDCPLYNLDIGNKTSENGTHFCHLFQFRFKYSILNHKNAKYLLFVCLEHIGEEEKLLHTLKELEFFYFAVDSNILIEYYDSNMHILHANQLYCDKLGYSVGEFTGKGYDFCDASYHSKQFHKDLLKTCKQHKVWQGLIKIKGRNNEEIWLDKTIIPAPEHTHIPYSYVALSYDVTTLKQSQNDLLLMTQVFEQSPASIMITDAKGFIEYVNPHFEKISGYKSEEIVGKKPSFLKSGYTSEEDYKNLWNKIKKGGTWHGQFCNKKKNGQLFWEFASIAPVKDFNGKITSYIALKEDITQLKKSEHILESNNALMSSVVDSISEGILAFDITDRVSMFNNRFLELFELTGKEVENLKRKDLVSQLGNYFTDSQEFDLFISNAENSPEIVHSKMFQLNNNRYFDFAIRPQSSYNRNYGMIWSFNDYTAIQFIQRQLMKNNQELTDINIELDRKTQILQNTIRELEIQKNIAETATKAKNEFLANMSHEIRTPMNSILGFTQILKNTLNDSKHKLFLDAIESSGNNLMILLNDLLDLSKIEAGKMIIKQNKVSFSKLSKELYNIFRLEAQRKGIDFEIKLAEDLPSNIIIDEIRLRQILFNIVGNAIKFTSKGAVLLDISASILSDKKLDLTFKIIDTGVGIEDSLQETIFDLFYHKTTEPQDVALGTGLGLAISRKLSHLMNGNITLKSKLGEGSSFYVKLNDIEYFYEEVPEDCCNAEEIAYFNNLIKVLVVDDVMLNRKLVSEFLADKNCQIFEAESGDAAIEIAKQEKPDIVFMDIKMPQMSGIEATAKLREMYADIIIVAITASVTYSAQEFKELTFNDFILKPLEQNELLRAIVSNLKIKEFEKKKTKQIKNKQLEFSKLHNSKDFFANLEEAYKLWTSIEKSKKISDIKQWVYAMNETAKLHECKSLADYCQKLSNSLEDFDFVQLPKYLAEFPDLYQKITNS
jgi:PAS domain S-box-containing protein